MERFFSQITRIIQKDSNCLNLYTVKGILHSKEVCHVAEIDDQLIYNVKAASARYRANYSIQEDINNDIIFKRKLEHAVEEKCKKDIRLKEIEGEENMLKEKEE